MAVVRIDQRLIILFLFLRVISSKKFLKDYAVKCHADRMDVSLEFDEPFGGVVFADRTYNQTRCRWEGRNTKLFNFSIPVSGDQPNCNGLFNEVTGELTVLLVISPMRKILVDGVSNLQVRCTYVLNDVTITFSGLRLIGTDEDTGLVTGNGGKPTLHIQILDGHGITGTPVSQASVGQRLTLDIVLQDTAIYDFHAHTCFAHDGSGSADATVQIIDPNGCGVALPRAINVPVHATEPTGNGAKHVYIYMYGFQFTSSEFVHFECQARTCIHQCKRQQCENNSTEAADKIPRIRRDSVEGSPLRLVTIIKMKPPPVIHASGFRLEDEPGCPTLGVFICLLVIVGVMPTLTLLVCYVGLAIKRKQSLSVQPSASSSSYCSSSSIDKRWPFASRSQPSRPVPVI